MDEHRSGGQLRFTVLRRDPDAPEWLVAGHAYVGALDRDHAGVRVWLRHPEPGNSAKYLAGLDDLEPMPDP